VSFRGEPSWTLLKHPRLQSMTTGFGYVLLFDRFFGDKRIYDLIHQRCLYSPIPIYWNNHLVAKKSAPWSRTQRLLERVREGQGLTLHLHKEPRVRQSGQRPELNPPTGLYCRQFFDGVQGQASADRSDSMVTCESALSIP